MQLFGGERIPKMLSRLSPEEGTCVSLPFISKQIEKTQKKVEERNYEARKSLLEYDEVMDFHRKYFYARRRNIIEGKGLKDVITEMVESIITRTCDNILVPGYPYNCIVEWARSSFNVDLNVKNISSMEVEEIEKLIKNRSKKTISNEISLSIGEYLDDLDDRKTWNLASLDRWAMSSFAVSLSPDKLRHMDYEEICDTLIEGVCHQVDKKDYSQMSEFLKDNFAVKSFTQLMSSRFDIKLTADDLKELKPEQVKQLVIDKVTEKYDQREIEYPVEFAMNMIYGSQGPNIYGLESLAKWAKAKYNVDLSPDDMQQLKPAKLHEQLLALSKSFSDGELDKEIDSTISSLAPNALADWVSCRFETKIDAEDLADPAKAKELIDKSAAKFMRTELSDLEKYVLIQIYDSAWEDHLYVMECLRYSLWTRSLAGISPRAEYKRGGDRLFYNMLQSVEDRVTNTIFKVHISPRG
jgi:preprotein translocase subunit SecA